MDDVEPAPDEAPVSMIVENDLELLIAQGRKRIHH